MRVKNTPLRVQSVRIVEQRMKLGPKRRTESCSIFGNTSNYDCETEEGKTISEPRPLNNQTYAAFKSANVVKGILCPSLTNSFKQHSLERSYLTYTHRQRQKSLIIVNLVNFMLKVTLVVIWFIKESKREGKVVSMQIYCVTFHMWILWQPLLVKQKLSMLKL
ncbi:adenylyl cyclase 78C-like [Zeugodacus cucurbitae]|uniref:adenylyl cyclase 78C-like n=1 Tax=Zeugodacus cucurbitae TaxID=28588 RepID=UPI0023D941D4|nr:adenylyl cyclase 78C-like [Zeugodacus cucurbitae]